MRDGALTLNEVRADMGREPYADPIYDEPMVVTSTGISPLVGPGSAMEVNKAQTEVAKKHG
jgi:hypothetical protein